MQAKDYTISINASEFNDKKMTTSCLWTTVKW